MSLEINVLLLFTLQTFPVDSRQKKQVEQNISCTWLNFQLDIQINSMTSFSPFYKIVHILTCIYTIVNMFCTLKKFQVGLLKTLVLEQQELRYPTLGECQREQSSVPYLITKNLCSVSFSSSPEQNHPRQLSPCYQGKGLAGG